MIITECFHDVEKAYQYVREAGLIHSERKCHCCSQDMKLAEKKGREVWKCSQCNTTSSILNDSIFQVCYLS